MCVCAVRKSENEGVAGEKKNTRASGLAVLKKLLLNTKRGV